MATEMHIRPPLKSRVKEEGGSRGFSKRMSRPVVGLVTSSYFRAFADPRYLFKSSSFHAANQGDPLERSQHGLGETRCGSKDKRHFKSQDPALASGTVSRENAGIECQFMNQHPRTERYELRSGRRGRSINRAASDARGMILCERGCNCFRRGTAMGSVAFSSSKMGMLFDARMKFHVCWMVSL